VDGKKDEMNPSGPRVSVIIPVYNCRETIVQCLDSMASINHPSFEIIVVDDGSTDGTKGICQSRDEIRVISLDRGGPSRARNTGITVAIGDLIAFTDGDCIADKDWLTALESGFRAPEVASVGGDQKSPDDETWMGKRIQEFLKCIGFMTGYIKTESTMGETDHNPSCNVMYRKSVLEEVGGFDEALFPSEDVDLDLKIRSRGYRLLYNPEAVVGHYRPRTYSDFAAMMRRYGASQRYLVKKYGFFRRLHYVPPLMVVGLAFAFGLLLWHPQVWPIIFVPALAAISWFYGKSRKLGKSLQFTYLLLITLINWNWGFLSGYRPFAGIKARTG
jgi:GT2 family glycosyltransferase